MKRASAITTSPSGSIPIMIHLFAWTGATHVAIGQEKKNKGKVRTGMKNGSLQRQIKIVVEHDAQLTKS